MLGEAEEKGIVSLNKPAAAEMEGHICRLCDCPDHRACGCEAKAATAQVKKAGTDFVGLLAGPEKPSIVENLKKITDHAASFDEKLDAFGDALGLIIENRDAALAVQRDIVEQLNIIAGHLGELVAQKKMMDSVKTGGPHGN